MNETPAQWSREDCAAYLGIAPSTWGSYVSRGVAPQPSGHIGAAPWWSSEAVIRWNENRPGPGYWGAHKTKETN